MEPSTTATGYHVHPYQDYGGAIAGAGAGAGDPGTVAAVAGGGGASFPLVLYQMLSEVDRVNEEVQRLGTAMRPPPIHWQPHGRCFVVTDRDYFVRSFLQVWFTMSTFESFQRQCNMYGFRRIGKCVCVCVSKCA